MAKIKIKTKLKTKDEEIKKDIKGVLNGNQITFIEDKIKVKVTFSNNGLIIKRSTKEYKMTLNFKKFLTITGKYDIKNIGILEIKTDTKKMLIEKNKIFVEYFIYINNENLGLNSYEIEYEEI